MQRRSPVGPLTATGRPVWPISQGAPAHVSLLSVVRYSTRIWACAYPKLILTASDTQRRMRSNTAHFFWYTAAMFHHRFTTFQLLFMAFALICAQPLQMVCSCACCESDRTEVDEAAGLSCCHALGHRQPGACSTTLPKVASSRAEIRRRLWGNATSLPSGPITARRLPPVQSFKPY